MAAALGSGASSTLGTGARELLRSDEDVAAALGTALALGLGDAWCGVVCRVVRLSG